MPERRDVDLEDAIIEKLSATLGDFDTAGNSREQLCQQRIRCGCEVAIGQMVRGGVPGGHCRRRCNSNSGYGIHVAIALNLLPSHHLGFRTTKVLRCSCLLNASRPALRVSIMASVSKTQPPQIPPDAACNAAQSRESSGNCGCGSRLSGVGRASNSWAPQSAP